jgi:hypothetical protein
MSDREKWASISITKGAGRKKDRKYKIDAEAYYRLRQEGHQPPQVEGSARLERDASLPFEITMGKVFDGKDKGAAQEGWDMSYDIGLRGPGNGPVR